MHAQIRRLPGRTEEWESVTETILFTDEAHALHMYRIGSICEPPPTEDAIAMTIALVNSAPLVANITDPTKRPPGTRAPRALANRSRAA